jgi:hypothetical protein
VVVQVAAPAMLQQASTPTPVITEEDDVGAPDSGPDPFLPPTPTDVPEQGAPVPDVAAATPTPTAADGGVIPNVPAPDVAGGTPTVIVSEEEDLGAPDDLAPQLPGVTIIPTSAAPGAVATPVPEIRPPTRPAQAVVPLPNTSATAPAAGVGFAMIGFALILHATRRVRAEDAALDGGLSIFTRLRSLAKAAERASRATAESTAEMEEQARRLRDMLDRRDE